MDRKAMFIKGRSLNLFLAPGSADVVGDIAGVDNLLDYLIALAMATSQNFTRTAYKIAQRTVVANFYEWNYDITSTKLHSFEVMLRFSSKSTKCVYVYK